jgi:hypothetical protein
MLCDEALGLCRYDWLLLADYLAALAAGCLVTLRVGSLGFMRLLMWMGEFDWSSRCQISYQRIIPTVLFFV